MRPSELAFVIGPLAAPVLGILAVVAVVVARPTKGILLLAVPLWVLTVASWLAYWFFWGIAFKRANRGVDPRTIFELATNAAMWCCAAGCVALVLTAERAVRSAPSTRTTGG